MERDVELRASVPGVSVERDSVAENGQTKVPPKDREGGVRKNASVEQTKPGGHSYSTRRQTGKTKPVIAAPNRRSKAKLGGKERTTTEDDDDDNEDGEGKEEKNDESELKEEPGGSADGKDDDSPIETTPPKSSREAETTTTTTKNDDDGEVLDAAAADDFLDLSWMRDIPTKPNKVECLLCNKIFTRKYCTNTHMILKHSQSGGVKCPVEGCGRVCASQSHFDKHYENIHGEQRAKRLAERAKRRQEAKERLSKRRESGGGGSGDRLRFMCHMCPKLCSRLEYLRNHVALVHEGKSKQKCPKCGRGFLKSRDLARHKCSGGGDGGDGGEAGTGGGIGSRVALEKNPIPKTPCPHCGKLFTKQWIKPHMSIEHKGEKETCSVCKRQFSCKGSLKLHYRNLHEGIRAKCPHCDQSFRDSWRLKMHVHSEHEGKRYKCEDCGKEYRSKDNLGRHRKIHAGVRFECHYCQASFGQKAPLTRHIKRKHGDGAAPSDTEHETSKNAATPRTVEEHLRVQHNFQQQQRQHQRPQLQGRVKNEASGMLELQGDVAHIKHEQQQQQQQQQRTNAIIVESGEPIRVGSIGAIVQTANGQTLTLVPQQLAQLTQQLDGNFGTFSLAPIEMDADDGTAGAVTVPARFALATADHEPETGTTIMHAIQMDGGTQAALPVTTTVAAALASDRALLPEVGSQQQQHQEQHPISIDALASLTPIQTNDGDKETKFYLIPSGSWTM